MTEDTTTPASGIWKRMDGEWTVRVEIEAAEVGARIRVVRADGRAEERIVTEVAKRGRKYGYVATSETPEAIAAKEAARAEREARRAAERAERQARREAEWAAEKAEAQHDALARGHAMWRRESGHWVLLASGAEVGQVITISKRDCNERAVVTAVYERADGTQSITTREYDTRRDAPDAPHTWIEWRNFGRKHEIDPLGKFFVKDGKVGVGIGEKWRAGRDDGFEPDPYEFGWDCEILVREAAPEEKAKYEAEVAAKAKVEEAQRVVGEAQRAGQYGEKIEKAVAGSERYSLTPSRIRRLGANSVWEIEPEGTLDRRIIFSDYQGADGDTWREGNYGWCTHAVWLPYSDEVSEAIRVTAAAAEAREAAYMGDPYEFVLEG